MKRMYVNKRSELSLIKQAFEEAGVTCYRTRMKCDCEQPSSQNNRDGLLIIHFGRVILEVIKCRGCSAKYSKTVKTIR